MGGSCSKNSNANYSRLKLYYVLNEPGYPKKELTVYSSDTLFDVREKLGQRWATSEILCNGEVLDDNRLTLHDYHLRDGDELYQPFGIRIQTLTRGTWFMNIDILTTIGELKGKIERMHRIEPALQQLIFNRQKITNLTNLPLVNLDQLLPDAVIYFILRLRGGAGCLTVKYVGTGETKPMPFEAPRTVKRVKQDIADLFGISPEDQSLFYKGKLLEDRRTISDYSIKVNSIIDLHHTQGIAIWVKSLQGQDMVFKVDPSLGVAEFKVRVSEQTNVPTNMFQLFLSKTCLRDAMPLNHYPIHDSCRLSMYTTFIGIKTIYVELIDLNRISMDVKSSTSVGDIKGMIEDRTATCGVPIGVQDVVYHNQTLDNSTDMSEVHIKATLDGAPEIVLEMKLSKMYSKRLKICKQLRKDFNQRSTFHEIVSDLTPSERQNLLTKPFVGDLNAIQLGLIANKPGWRFPRFYQETLLMEMEELIGMSTKEFSNGYNMIEYLTKLNVVPMLRHILECYHSSKSGRRFDDVCSNLLKFAVSNGCKDKTVLTVIDSPFADLNRAKLSSDDLLYMLPIVARDSDNLNNLQEVCRFMEVKKIKLRSIDELPRMQPLSNQQIKLVYPLSDSYVIPSNMARSRPCAIIGYNTNNRPGAEREARILETAFKTSKFSVDKFNWEYFWQLLNGLSTTLRKICDNCSAVFVSVMCHGFRGNLQGNEGSYGPINELLNIVEEKLPPWIPVVILIQACQGAKIPSCTVPANRDAGVPTSTPHSIVLQRPNTVLLLATVMGRYAIRGAYTTAIANQLSRSDGRTSIEVMHTRAVDEMQKEAEGAADQTPEIRHTLNKQLILPAAK